MKTKVWFGFAALCLWSGSAWLYDLFAPAALTGLVRTATHNGILALVCWLWCVSRREAVPKPAFWAKLAVGGALMFATPEVVLTGASRYLSQSTEVLVFMLVPVVVVFWVGHQSAGFGAAGGSLRGLVPALAGLGGAALVLPFELPGSLVGRCWLAALVMSAVVAGIAAVQMYIWAQGISVARLGTIIFGTGCLITVAFCWLGWSGTPTLTWSGLSFEALRLAAVDGPILLLTLWLLPRMRPIGLASRLLLVPAVIVLEGIIAERPDVGWYGWLGLALTLGAGILLAREDATAGAS